MCNSSKCLDRFLLTFSIHSSFPQGKIPAQCPYGRKPNARECEGWFQQDSCAGRCLSTSINANSIGLCSFRNSKQLHANPTHSPSASPHCVPDSGLHGGFLRGEAGGGGGRVVSSLEKFEESHSRPSRDSSSLLVFFCDFVPSLLAAKSLQEKGKCANCS